MSRTKAPTHPAAIDASQSIDWDAPRGRFEHLPTPPLRWICVGPSGSGKGVALQNICINHYRGAFERIIVVSPTAITDTSTWGPVKKYLEKDKGIDLKKEPAFFEEFDVGVLQQIVDRHRKIVQVQKDRGEKRLFNLLLIVDDYAEDQQVMRYGKNGQFLNQCFLKGRHWGLSTILSVQKLTLVANPCRINATGILAFKVRNAKEYEAIEGESSALIDRATFKSVWEAATSEPYSFLFIRLNAKSLDETFMVRFEKAITFPDDDLSPPPEPHDDWSSSAQSTRGRALGR